MVYFNILMLLSVRLCPASGESFVTGVQMQTNVMASYGATACDLLKAKARGLWTDGTFQSCFVLNSLEVAQNLYAIVFRIVVDSEKLQGYSEGMNYFAKAALVNSRLNNGHNYCHTVTGREWMKPVPTLGTTFAFKAFYSRFPSNVNCSTILSIAQHSIKDLPLFGCDNVDSPTENENHTAAYFYIRLKTFRTSSLLSTDLFRTLFSFAHTINYKENACISVESVTSFHGWGRLTIAISEVNKHDRQNLCNWFVGKYKSAIQTGPFYNCAYQVELAYRNTILLNLDLRKTLDGMPLDSMDNSEIAWRTESLFNSKIPGCICYDPEDLHVVFQKGMQNEYYEMFLSGPLDEDVCKKIKKYYKADYTTMFSTCERQVNVNSPQFSSNYSLHVLKSIKPVYLIDYRNYVDSHRRMLYALNEQGCKYNGFVASLYEQRNFLVNKESE